MEKRKRKRRRKEWKIWVDRMPISLVPNPLARSRLLAHLEDQHSAFSGVDFLVAGCSMTSTERDAVRNVVQGRTPSLMQLPVSH